MAETSTKSQAPITVLVLAASTQQGEGSLNSEQEERIIQDVTRHSCEAGKMKLERVPAFKIADALTQVNQYKPQVVHIIAHGLHDPGGALNIGGEWRSPSTLVEILASSKHMIECLIISACNLRPYNGNYSQCCKFLVGCTGELKGGSAVSFATGFYSLLQSLPGPLSPEDIEACAKAGTALAKNSDNVSEDEVLRIHQKPAQKPPFWASLRPVDKGDSPAKSRTYFGEKPILFCEGGAMVAEVAATIKVIKDEQDVVQKLEALRHEAVVLSEIQNETEPLTYKRATEQINDMIHSLFSTARETLELKSVRHLITDGDVIETVRTTLLCKLQGRSVDVHYVDDFCREAQIIMERSANPLNDVESCTLILTASRFAKTVGRLIDSMEKCIDDRFEGFARAVENEFAEAGTMEDAIATLVAHLPHYSHRQPTGKTLWTAIEGAVG